MNDYTIWTVSPHTGSKRECIARYSNRGHAIARLRGLRRAHPDSDYVLQSEKR